MTTRHSVATRLVLLAAACHLALGAEECAVCGVCCGHTGRWSLVHLNGTRNKAYYHGRKMYKNMTARSLDERAVRTGAVWCVPALRVPLVQSLINHFRQN